MTDWRDADHLVIDTESTGPDIAIAEVVEFGAVVFRRGEPGARRSRLIRPRAPVPAEASAVHGITDADVADAPSIAEVAPGLLATIRRYPVVVSYNGAGYDWPLLRRLLGPEAWDEATRDALLIDPLPWMWGDRERRYWKGKGRHGLAEVGRRLGLPAEDAHRAVADCLICGRALWAIRAELPPDAAAVRAGQARLREERASDWFNFATGVRAKAVAAAYAATEGAAGLPPRGSGDPARYWRAVAVVLGEAGDPAAEVAEEAARTLEKEADARRQWDEARDFARQTLTGPQEGGRLTPP